MIRDYPFIVLEGPDGVGKTTLCDWLSNIYGYKKYKCIGGPFANVRKQFDRGEVSVSERFSFLCGEAINNSFIINEELKLGNSIVFDRYYYSTLAYCEIAKPGITSNFNFLFNQLPKPNCVFLINTDFETMLSRISKRGDLANLEKTFTVKENYEMLIAKYMEFIGEKICVIDNNKTLDFTKEQIKKVICMKGDVF